MCLSTVGIKITRSFLFLILFLVLVLEKFVLSLSSSSSVVFVALLKLPSSSSSVRLGLDEMNFRGKSSICIASGSEVELRDEEVGDMVLMSGCMS